MSQTIVIAEPTFTVHCPVCDRVLFKAEMSQSPIDSNEYGRVFLVPCKGCRKKRRIVLFDKPSERTA